MKTELPDFDTVDIDQLCAGAERDPLLREQLGNLLKEATISDKFYCVAIASWLLAGRERPIQDDSEVNSLYQRAFALIDDLTDDGKLRLLSDLIPHIGPGEDEDDSIIPPDCEFDDLMPPSLAIV